MSRANPFSDTQLLEFSEEHLLYEFQIFRWVADSIAKKPTGFESSALLESFIIHLRNLSDFFYSDSDRNDDVLAADFFDKPEEWKSGAMPQTLKDARERANKEVSHITYKRKGAGDIAKSWNVTGLSNDIETTAKQFAAAASKKKLHSKVVEWIESKGDVRAMLIVNASTATTNVASTVVTVGWQVPQGRGSKSG